MPRQLNSCEAVLEELNFFVEGESELAAEVAAHLDGCADCRQEEASLRQAGLALTAHAYEPDGMDGERVERILQRLPSRARGPLWIPLTAAAALLAVFILRFVEPTAGVSQPKSLPEVQVIADRSDPEPEPETMAASTVGKFRLGDVNGDGVRNAADVEELILFLVLDTQDALRCLGALDFDRDGQIAWSDLQLSVLVATQSQEALGFSSTELVSCEELLECAI